MKAHVEYHFVSQLQDDWWSTFCRIYLVSWLQQ